MTPQDEQLLEVVAEHVNRARDGRLETAIRERTGMSSARAWQRVNALLEDEEAWAAYPVAMRTLRSRRESGRRGSPRSA